VGQVRRVARAALLLVVSFSSAHAQAPSGTITGVVTDSTGTFVGEARVHVTNLSTAQSWTLVTSVEGIYTFAALGPGEYQVSVEVPGFKRADVNTRVETGTTTSVDLVLELAPIVRVECPSNAGRASPCRFRR